MIFKKNYIKNGNLKNILRTKSDLNIYTKTHQIAPFKKILGSMPPNPSRHANFQNLKNNSRSPLPNPGCALEASVSFICFSHYN